MKPETDSVFVALRHHTTGQEEECEGSEGEGGGRSSSVLAF